MRKTHALRWRKKKGEMGGRAEDYIALSLRVIGGPLCKILA
jgi:hypothetical protein